MQETNITSVGIDIGTTTTQLVFSALTLRNTAGPTQAPRYAITGRDIIYGSPVVFTPKKAALAGGAAGASRILQDGEIAEDSIDEAALASLVASWYADAGIRREDVTTGAVIITGESLKTPNARNAVMTLSDSLGDFVVATAGPHLESVIAGRGSGAASLSRKLSGTVLNIDIGGGTSNYAVFRSGNVIDTACLNVGGRLVETGPDGRALRIHAPARIILEELYGSLPNELDETHYAALAARMADMLYDTAIGVADTLTRKLLQTPPLQANYHYDAVTISGGVGACCQEPPAAPFRYGDLGPMLAEAILRNPNLARLPLHPPAATVRATVIGAGAWSLSLSGSTVWAEQKAFPLRNVPVITLPLVFPDDWAASPPDLAAYIRERVGLFDLDPGAEPFVLSFGAMPATYAVVRYLAEGLARFYASLPAASFPLIVALYEDMGKILGMELKPEISGRPLVVVDEVHLAEGDYLDLGKPLQEGGFVPLVVKSLAFSGES